MGLWAGGDGRWGSRMMKGLDVFGTMLMTATIDDGDDELGK